MADVAGGVSTRSAEMRLNQVEFGVMVEALRSHWRGAGFGTSYDFFSIYRGF